MWCLGSAAGTKAKVACFAYVQNAAMMTYINTAAANQLAAFTNTAQWLMLPKSAVQNLHRKIEKLLNQDAVHRQIRQGAQDSVIKSSPGRFCSAFPAHWGWHDHGNPTNHPLVAVRRSSLLSQPAAGAMDTSAPFGPPSVRMRS